ncbi:MAG TPA: hypothetical protein VMS31_21740 [Pyrinomonadaceae bacterium]|nr:hypothetical protein [Pyrinomonadaceae bacterium]
MKTIKGYRKMPLRPKRLSRRKSSLVVSLLLVVLLGPTPFIPVLAQGESTSQTKTPANIFRLERTAVQGGAELITIHARLDGIDSSEELNWFPLVSVLRDTLGDLNRENDRLRYVWPLTYTRPTMWQRASSAVPFLYRRVGNKSQASGKVPPPVLDLAAPDREVWNRIFWASLQSLLLDPYGTPIKASTRSYQQNVSAYRKSHVIRALSVLALYQAIEAKPAFSESEFSEIQARLLLTDKTFGGLVDSLRLEGYYRKELMGIRDERGHNWELLRQRAEAESLYFEPLQMPDGSATHALLWVDKHELTAKQGARYRKRFLNIEDPWSDKRLLKWSGYVETRFLDSENRPVSQDAPGARAVELIPLALYGLDNPKIPMLLVDFRSSLNPKKREMSRRVLQDVTRNILSLSRFGDVPYFLGRTVYDVVTGRRGMDINQPSRLQTYSQLKLFLSLDRSLDPQLRDEISGRLEKVSLNPLENDLEAEGNLARQQHAALIAYANSPDGLPAKLARDRRAEAVSLEHGKTQRALFQLANILSFGKYTHREKAEPDIDARLDIARRLNYHTRFLREVSQSSPQIEVLWNLDDVRRSLRFIAEHGSLADSKAISATAKIFDRTMDDETRRLCLDSLSRMDNPKARLELIRISQHKDLPQTWRDLITASLNNPRRMEPLADSAPTRNTSAAEQR